MIKFNYTFGTKDKKIIKVLVQPNAIKQIREFKHNGETITEVVCQLYDDANPTTITCHESLEEIQEQFKNMKYFGASVWGET